MPNGYTGNIARINLADRAVSVEQPDETFYRRYYGGRNFIGYYLLNEVGPEVDSLSPENKLIFATGLITGAPIAGSGRNSVGARSPLTNAYGEAEAGGFWGPELKRAGFDALILEGKADAPVYLWVHDGEVQIRDATHLWGMTTENSQTAIHEELGDKGIRTAQIGAGGENLARFACIINDLHYAYGRSGMGAVMGSKNLKAIAVRGRNRLEFAEREKLNEFVKWMEEHIPKGFQDTGTGGGLLGLNEGGGLPTHNFQEGQFAGARAISGQMMRDTILIDRKGCYACPVRCKRVVETDSPYKVSPTYGGPEYETLGSVGSNCGVDELAAIAKANELCNAYSLDTIGVGTTIAFAMECFERGILTLEDTDGLELRFGNASAMVQMVEKIAHREGIGDMLAEGVMRASRQIGKGAEEYAMHIKGQELPMHEPRFKQGMGMGYAISPTGADHMQSI
ncbi:MAG: aldehyde ferredoxin oxidoreductase C-terminal domain-containing protein, partial [Bacteroidota bacterium]